MLAEILVFELVLRLPCVIECSERGYRVKLTVKSFHFIEKVWELVARNTLFFIMVFSMECEYFWLNGFLCEVKGNLVSLEKKMVSLQHYKPPWFCIFAIFSHLWLHVRFWCCEVCWFSCCELILGIAGELVCASIPGVFVVFSSHFSGRGNF